MDIRRKLWKWYSGRESGVIAFLAALYIVISFLGDVTPWNLSDYLTNPIARFIATLLLIAYVGFNWWREHNEKLDILETNVKMKPVIRVLDYGKEDKPLYTTLVDIKDVPRAKYETDYDVLFLIVYNKQKYGEAKKVWSKIDWMDKKENIIKSHQGRWHIANPNKEVKKEDLQYIDLDSNGHPEKLHFACRNKSREEEFFYGLCREMDGRESWDNPNYKLDAKQYVVRITLSGSNDVSQVFKYLVKNDQGNIFIAKALTDESEKETPKKQKEKKAKKPSQRRAS